MGCEPWRMLLWITYLFLDKQCDRNQEHDFARPGQVFLHSKLCMRLSHKELQKSITWSRWTILCRTVSQSFNWYCVLSQLMICELKCSQSAFWDNKSNLMCQVFEESVTSIVQIGTCTKVVFLWFLYSEHQNEKHTVDRCEEEVHLEVRHSKSLWQDWRNIVLNHTFHRWSMTYGHVGMIHQSSDLCARAYRLSQPRHCTPSSTWACGPKLEHGILQQNFLQCNHFLCPACCWWEKKFCFCFGCVLEEPTFKIISFSPIWEHAQVKSEMWGINLPPTSRQRSNSFGIIATQRARNLHIGTDIQKREPSHFFRNRRRKNQHSEYCQKKNKLLFILTFLFSATCSGWVSDSFCWEKTNLPMNFTLTFTKVFLFVKRKWLKQSKIISSQHTFAVGQICCQKWTSNNKSRTHVFHCILVTRNPLWLALLSPRLVSHDWIDFHKEQNESKTKLRWWAERCTTSKSTVISMHHKFLKTNKFKKKSLATWSTSTILLVTSISVPKLLPLLCGWWCACSCRLCLCPNRCCASTSTWWAN